MNFTIGCSVSVGQIKGEGWDSDGTPLNWYLPLGRAAIWTRLGTDTEHRMWLAPTPGHDHNQPPPPDWQVLKHRPMLRVWGVSLSTVSKKELHICKGHFCLGIDPTCGCLVWRQGVSIRVAQAYALGLGQKKKTPGLLYSYWKGRGSSSRMFCLAQVVSHV